MNNLNDFYKSVTDEYNEKTLFDNFISYREGYELAKRRAAFCLKKGFKEGDVIGISAVNSREWIMTYMSITMCGCIALPLDNNLPPETQISMIKEVNGKGLFTDKKELFKIRGAKVFEIDFNLNLDEAKKYRAPKVNSEFPASYVFTSGTTGKPKIITLTHGNVYKTAVSCSDWLGLSVTDNFLCILPLFHVYAFLANFAGPYAKGASLVFLQSLKGPDIVATLKKNDFTIFPAAPQLWEMFMDSILKKVKNESSLKYGVLLFFLKTQPFFRHTGLSFIPKAVFKPVRQVFGESMNYFISGGAPLKKKYFRYYERMNLPIIEGYGLTETTGPIAISHVKRNKMGSVGPAMPGNEIKIKNTNEDGIGEVWLKGHSVMKEYYKNPEQTREVFDDDGYFNSGDLGKVDKNGYLFITGRFKNVIVLDSGKNVYPEELESFYKNSPEIAEISVFGKQINGKETVYAVIVPEKKSQRSFSIIQDEIKRLNRGLPTYKTISIFALSMDPLPVNSARKIVVSDVIRNLDRGNYMTAPDDKPTHTAVIAGDSDREKAIIKILRDELNLKEIHANESLADYGVDSLKIIEIVANMEEVLNISIDIAAFRNAETFQEIVTYISGLKEGEQKKNDFDLLSSPITNSAGSLFNPINELLVLVMKLIAKRCWQLSLKEPENLEIDNTIIIANHQSNLDYMLMFCLLPYKKRRELFVIGKKELWFLKYIFPGSNVLFVERDGNVMTALKAGADMLRQGKSLFIFPEGTRSTGSNILPFKSGAAYLAINLGKKIVPLAICGTAKVLPKGRTMPKLRKATSIIIQAGKAIEPGKFRTVESLNKKLQAVVKSLTKETEKENIRESA